MKQRRIVPGIFAALGMLLLILDSRTALLGAQEGIGLCIQTVIPSLLPFFVLSGILVSSLTGTSLPVLRPLGALLGIPKGGESLLICGFLGGYPVGAKAVRDAWASGQLTKEDAQRLLSFCNNAGPAFLFGMAAPMFSGPFAGWLLWGIHILSAMFAGILLKIEPKSRIQFPSEDTVTLSEALKRALSVTAQVCGWVVLFRVVSAFLNHWFLWLLPGWAQAAITGFLELANGCIALGQVSGEELRFVLCSAMLAFGGVCVSMQTVSVTKGLDLRQYFAGKMLQTLFCILISIAIIRKMFVLWLIPLALLLLNRKNAKKGGNPEPVGV